MFVAMSVSQCMSFVAAAVSYGVYLFNTFPIFLWVKVSPMFSETNQYESSHDDDDDEKVMYIIGYHHLCALINSQDILLSIKTLEEK